MIDYMNPATGMDFLVANAGVQVYATGAEYWEDHSGTSFIKPWQNVYMQRTSSDPIPFIMFKLNPCDSKGILSRMAQIMMDYMGFVCVHDNLFIWVPSGYNSITGAGSRPPLIDP